MTEQQLEPYDPTDPFQIAADNFRVAVLRAYMETSKTAVFRELKEEEKIASFLCGTMTGMLFCVVAGLPSIPSTEKQHRMAAQISKLAIDCFPNAIEMVKDEL